LNVTYDYLVVGAGLAGATAAERLASELEATVLIVDSRPHVAGNAYDPLNEAGVRVHLYGPHIFHTSSARVVDYLSAFTAWRPYEHRVMADVDGKYIPLPISALTIEALYGVRLDEAEAAAFFASRREEHRHITNSEQAIVSKIGRELFETLFAGYTRKHWGLEPRDLDATVCGRIPIRTNRDDRYFADRFQIMPADGFETMIRRMLDHPLIDVSLGTTFAQAAGRTHFRHLVFTGPIDAYYEHRYGHLPYRSLRFEFETFDRSRVQPVGVINYPGAEPYTRVTEFKHLTGQVHDMTTIAREYPQAHGDPYYPIPNPDARAQYAKYAARAARETNVTFVGRLAEYRYYNMDQVVASALAAVDRIAAERVA
jgi:UDP-galactopyranose mutase